jgi:imidazolonepropionase
MNNLFIKNAHLVTPQGNNPLRGSEMSQLLVIPNISILIIDGIINKIGKEEDIKVPADIDIYDAEGRVVLPGFVDSHTHLIFGGYRPDEFDMRLKGATYMSIMEQGGGIQSTVNATRVSTAEDLESKALYYLRIMSRMGVTTVEAKSGYGLDVESERKMLEVIQSLSKKCVDEITIVPTFLGAHAVPNEYKGRTSEYVDLIINDMLPAFRELAVNCDIFCEKNVFEIEDSRRLLEAARELGYKLKLHADEIVTLGGAELAAELGALSADHLLHVSDKGIQDMANAGVVATLLPLTAFTLKEPYAPARKFIDSGAAVALATDLNPGSCFSGSIPLTIALACIYMNMSIEEVITALTLNGAAALGMADKIGSIEEGKRGDLVILDFDNYKMLPYYVGMNCVKNTIHAGKIINLN